MDSLVAFLKQGSLPEDKGKAKKVPKKAPHYWLFEEQKLYKHSYSGLYLLCVHLEPMEPLLEELHEGIYGSHTGGRFLAHKALTQGYWWLSMQKASQDYVTNVQGQVLESVTNVRDMPQIFINQGES